MDRVAVVGIGGIFPNVATSLPDDLAAFWQLIQAGVDCSREVPQDRWILNKKEVWGDDVKIDKVNAIRGCFVDMDVLAQSSAEFADLAVDTELLAKLDPMFHLLLRAGQQAWQDTQSTKQLDKNRVGVIVGNIVLPTDASSALADQLVGTSLASQWFGTENTKTATTESLNRYVAGLPAGLLAKALELGGGSYTLDAACASSLYALKYAVDALLSGRADAMLTGGVSRPDSLYTQMGFSALGAISKTGRCAPFDQKADGLIVGEGCGILVLKRLSDAIRDKDHIYATIAGIGLSNDIAGNLMSPDSEGQLRAMQVAYQQAGWVPDHVDLIECHGTGTPVGDETELQSLRSFWSQNLVNDQQSCVMGSVKSNIGHLLTAAGSAGLIKVLLAMKHQQLPPTANFAHAIGGSVQPFRVLNKVEEWQQRDVKTPRRAAVSAFGFGGINAHVLLEEYRVGGEEFSVNHQKSTTNNITNTDIAIVGMETHFGPWGSLDAFKQRCLSGEQSQPPKIASHWWGVDNPNQISGWCIEDLAIPIGRYRIPPTELKEMLPQQLLMLVVATNALQDAGIVEQLGKPAGEKTGVFIGIGLDLNTTNFHLRWSFKRQAAQWCAQQQKKRTKKMDAALLQQWYQSILDTVSPALNANRTMGSLGGIVASRIARVFAMGGASFTISSEESSGLQALQVATHALQKGELDMAVVGAVDFSGDVRAALAQNVHRAYSEHTQLGEGAAAFVLKRYADAQRDGDRVYAVIKGVGLASGSEADEIIPTEQAYQRAFDVACTEAKVKLSDISLIEAHGSGYVQEDIMEAGALVDMFQQVPAQKAHGDMPCVLSSVQAEIGHTGAASGLASLARASLCLYHRIWPRFVQPSPLFVQLLSHFQHHDKLVMLMQPQRWLNRQVGSSRLAAVHAFSIGGNCVSAILAAVDSPLENINLLQCKTVLFEFYAQTSIALLEQLQLFATQITKYNPPDLAQHWRKQQNLKQKQYSAAIVTDDPKHLKNALDNLLQAIEKDQLINSDGVYFSPQNSQTTGKLGFVYPGLGNDFPGMEQKISQQWPAVFEHFNLDSDPLLTEVVKMQFWQEESVEDSGCNQKIIRQLWCNSFLHDVLAQFNVKPSAILGYSVGESSGLIATRTWKDRNGLVQAICNTDLFTKGLTGVYDCVRNSWQLHVSEQVDWATYVVSASATEIRQHLATGLNSYFRVYILIINTANECIVGGDRKATMQFLQALAKPASEIFNFPALHCEVVAQVREDYRALYLFPTDPPKAVDFYSAVLGKHDVITRASVADAITAQAIQTFDYNAIIESAYADGVRLFIELGPGVSCTRIISSILGDRQHIARSICVQDQDHVKSMLLCLGQLVAEHIPINTNILYGTQLVTPKQKVFPVMRMSIGAGALHLPALPTPAAKQKPPVSKVAEANAAAKQKPLVSKAAEANAAAKQKPLVSKAAEANAAAKQKPPASKVAEANAAAKQKSPVSKVVEANAGAKQKPPVPKVAEANAGAKQKPPASKVAEANAGAKQKSLVSKVAEANATAKQKPPVSKVAEANAGAKQKSPVPEVAEANVAAKQKPPAPEVAEANAEAKQKPPAPEVAEAKSLPVTKKQSDELTRLIAQMQSTEVAKTSTHSSFLSVSSSITKTLAAALELETLLLQKILPSELEGSVATSDQKVLFDRETCMKIATGSIAEVLGENFADIDQYPSRVRLPDEPLMLVDRIISIAGDQDSVSRDLKTHGSIITEHDILPQSWYLDSGHIPICMAVEAGQADLFLAGYLGIDHITLGNAFYRLLDAKVVFHDSLPVAGQTIRYHIHIDHFFKQDETHLFRFNFEASVNDKPLLSMMEGCAGFFTPAQLDAGQGIVQTKLEISTQTGRLLADWLEFVPMQVESYSDAQINALRQGDLVACFGENFANLSFVRPVGLPSGKMTLVHRVLNLDPHGGRFGIGQITAESDIHPDDWFLTCHFSDDPVMPGTLMYECCLHTLRIYLLRMGWVGEQGEFSYQPIVGISSQLKCRGQVTAATKKIQYEITLKEIAYQDDGTPYALAMALIYSDHRIIVQMDNMSLQLKGLSRQKIIDYWQQAAVDTPPIAEKKILFDTASIYAFAVGKPSDAFGDRYKIFDEHRQIARLPRPPYQLLDRIVAIEACQPWQLKAGGKIVAEYDVLSDAWYFAQNRQEYMPFAILLEIALQPCGWLAAYLGSALTSEEDLSFRNLGGTGMQYMTVHAAIGTLSTHVEITKVSQLSNMIIQDYNMSIYSGASLVYKGHTQFGFFSKQALQDQIGIRGVDLYQPDADSYDRSLVFAYPNEPPYPDQMLRMVDNITLLDPKGGTHGLGFIKGTSRVDARAWFFVAHFYQDPVWPGSLGLESFIQILKAFAIAKWGTHGELHLQKFEAVALQQQHHWLYRGQIVPQDNEVTIEAMITHVDNKQQLIRADGFLLIDGRIIYQMDGFTLRMFK